jgi:hypothetical protein
MKLTKKQLIFLITIILLLGLITFILININLAHKRIEIFKETKISCENLNEGDKCSFFLNEKEIKGICEKNRKEILACKPTRPPSKE